MTPSPAEAFLFPLVWGLLFASIGALVGAFGMDWRREGGRLLGVWATPFAATLRVLAVALGACALVTVAAALIIAGGIPGAYTAWIRARAPCPGVTLLALPTAIAAVFVSGFGVPFDWNVNALSEGHGSIGALGGTMPTSNAGLAHAHGAPGVLALAPALVLIAVFAVGWLSARRSQSNIKLCFANALRAAALADACRLAARPARARRRPGRRAARLPRRTGRQRPDLAGAAGRLHRLPGRQPRVLGEPRERRSSTAATRTAACRATLRLVGRHRRGDSCSTEPGLARRHRRRFRRGATARDRAGPGRCGAAVGTGPGLGRADRTRSERPLVRRRTPGRGRRSKSPPARKPA